MDRQAIADIPTATATPRTETDMKSWAGGAKRSKAMPDWWMSPWKAIKGVLTRFTIGRKYGVNNWKKTLSVPYTDWYKGEETGESALDFVRQFYAHGQEHFVQASLLADKPYGYASEKGDDFLANLYAYGWNALALIEYAIENEQMVRHALSQYPQGHPARLQFEPQFIGSSTLIATQGISSGLLNVGGMAFSEGQPR